MDSEQTVSTWPPPPKNACPRSVSLCKGPRYPICGQVRDVDGALWNVRDVRTTKHGLDLYYGSPDKAHDTHRGGPLRLIVTKDLRDFWWDNRLESHGLLFDLPAGRTTLKRARNRLQFNQRDAVRDFWTERLDDLATLPTCEFAAKYGVDKTRAFDWRFRLVGQRARPLGWWRTPETFKILLSDMKLREVGEELGIGTSHAMRLRRRAKQESQ
ncbi:MAG: hypothetical protein WBW33_03015 [Bryobacteraceae bacterium]